MGYEKTSIREVLNRMENKSLLLPAFQRKFVWDPERVENLMDSLMRGYPIGTFLFWELDKKNYDQGEFTFYEFMKVFNAYDKRRNEPAAEVTQHQSIWTALDGQQRLTAIYISFRGTMGVHAKGRRWNKRASYPDKAMYVNLKHDFQSLETEGSGFKFFEPSKVPGADSDALWFRVSDISKQPSKNEVRGYARSQGYDDQAIDNLTDLWELERDDGMLNYYRSSGDDIDEVLEIFVRVNSGAVSLSRSDLLFSTIIATWPKAREEFDDAQERINETGARFRFSTDFIVRCALACTKAPMQMRVKTFNSTNVSSIKNKWPRIHEAMAQAVELASEFGFHEENLVAPNAMIPMVLYCFENGKPSKATRGELKKYLIVSQLNQIYGASADSALTKMNAKVLEMGKLFSLKKLRDLDFSGRRNLRFDEEEIQGLLDYKKGSPYAFMVLSLLYPDIKAGVFTCHQDHLHPYSGFETEKLLKMGLSEEKAAEWREMRDTIPNLQLLDGESNESKNAMPLEQWMRENPAQAARIKAAYGDGVTSYEFKDFEAFMARRRANMATRLREILID